MKLTVIHREQESLAARHISGQISAMSDACGRARLTCLTLACWIVRSRYPLALSPAGEEVSDDIGGELVRTMV